MENQENKQNYDASKSNFFKDISPNHPAQSQFQNIFPIQQASQSQAFVPQISQMPMYNQIENQQVPTV